MKILLIKVLFFKNNPCPRLESILKAKILYPMWIRATSKIVISSLYLYVFFLLFCFFLQADYLKKTHKPLKDFLNRIIIRKKNNYFACYKFFIRIYLKRERALRVLDRNIILKKPDLMMKMMIRMMIVNRRWIRSRKLLI